MKHLDMLQKLGLGDNWASLGILIAVGMVMFGSLILVAIALHKRQTKHDFTTSGLHIINGRMGAGKTYLMTWAALIALKRGLKVYANYWLCPKGKHHDKDEQGERIRCDNCVPLVTCWTDVLAVQGNTQYRPVLILLDEMHVWWAVYDTKAGRTLENWISSLRKNGLMLLGTTQDYTFLAQRVRRLAYSCWLGAPGGLSGHKYKSYDPHSFDPYRKNLGPTLGRFSLHRHKKIMRSYDTREVILPADIDPAVEAALAPVAAPRLAPDDFIETDLYSPKHARMPRRMVA